MRKLRILFYKSSLYRVFNIFLMFFALIFPILSTTIRSFSSAFITASMVLNSLSKAFDKLGPMPGRL